MNIGRNQIEVTFSVREAQSLLILLTEINRDNSNRYKGTVSVGVINDNINLQRELERLLLSASSGHSSIQTGGR